MKQTIISRFLAVALMMTTGNLAANAGWTDSLSPYDLNAPLGWATVDGNVTGARVAQRLLLLTKQN